KAAAFGLTEQQIIGQVQMQFMGQVAAKYREEGQEIDITLIYPEEYRSSIENLETMQIRTNSGAAIPLAEVASIEEIQGPIALNRHNRQPEINVSSAISGRDLRSVMTDIEAVLEEMSMPEGYSYTMAGQAEDMVEAFTELAIALFFSIFLVYAVMAVQFENFLYPFIIMFALPTSVIGVVLGLAVTGIPFSVPGFIGIIMLAGKIGRAHV